LNQSTHSRVAYSTASMLRLGHLLRITSVLYSPLIVSAGALSYESPSPVTGCAARTRRDTSACLSGLRQVGKLAVTEQPRHTDFGNDDERARTERQEATDSGRNTQGQRLLVEHRA
jgi:hypothetical protein